MMKMKLLLMLLAIALVAGVAQANMLLNPSFEDGIFAAQGVPDYWEKSWVSYYSAWTWFDDADAAHWGSRYIKMASYNVSASTAWIGQTVDVTEGQEYAFSVWAKCPDIGETSKARGFIEWLNSASAIISGDWLPLGWDADNEWTYVEFGTATAPALATQAVFYLAGVLENGPMGILYDDAYMDIVLPSLPSPPWDALVAIGNVDLSWTNIAPDVGDSVYVDVWFGLDPTKPTKPGNWYKVVDAGLNTTSVTVEDLDVGTYYWQVDSYIYGSPTGDPIEGHLWSFDVVADVPPSSVDVGVDMITWSGESVDLDATVVDDGTSPLTCAWSSDNPAGTDVFFSATDVEDPTVTITLVPNPAATIVNPSFENGLTGWDTVSFCGTWTGAWGGTTYIIPTDGYMCAYVDGTFGDPIEGGWLSQTLTETLAADTTYTLTVDVANDGYYNENVEYKVQLLAGEAVIAEDDDSWALNTFGEWKTSTVIFSTGATHAYSGEPLGIRLVAKVGTMEMTFDNVNLTADPPFPAPTGISTVELTLAASDEANPTYVLKDSMTIDIYDDACAAARVGLSLAEDNPTDIDDNCNTDVTDLVEFVASWLESTELTAPEAKDFGQGDVIGNAGFEDPPQAPGEWSSTCFDPPSDYHWTKIGNGAGVWNPGLSRPGYGDDTPEGENCAYVAVGSGITQVLTETLKAEMNYTLSVQVGNNAYDIGGTYTIELLAGGTPLVSHTEDIDDIEDDTFELRTLEYEYDSEQAALLGQPLEIRMTVSWGGWLEADFDDVKLEIKHVNPNLPSVNAGDSWITWSGQEVQLDPTVTPNEGDLSYAWSADDDTGVLFSPSATVEAPTVTITKATLNPSAVKLTLAVTLDGEVGTVEDSMTIDVYDNPCQAAIIGFGQEIDPGDFDANCITNLADFAGLAEAWLDDYTLTGPVPKPE